jgi:uncharacterized protein YceK
VFILQTKDVKKVTLMIKKLAVVIVLVMIASLSVCGCVTSTTNNTQSDKTTFSSDRGYNITYPKAWVKDVNTSANAPVELYLNINPNNTLDGVNVATAKLNATTGTTLQRWLDYNLNGLSLSKDYALVSLENTALAGRPASKVVWQARVPQKISETNYQNVPLKVMQVYLIHNGTGYVITYKATQSDYILYLTQAQQAINSFEFSSR